MILEWLGLDVSPQCEGASLLLATETGSFGEKWRKEAHWEFDFSRGVAPGGAGASVVALQAQRRARRDLRTVFSPTAIRPPNSLPRKFTTALAAVLGLLPSTRRGWRNRTQPL